MLLGNDKLAIGGILSILLWAMGCQDDPKQGDSATGDTTSQDSPPVQDSDTGSLPASQGAVRLAYLFVTADTLADESYPSDEQISRLTHVNVSFFDIEGGTVVHGYDQQQLTAFLDRLRAQCNEYGVKMLASVGGWAYANPKAEGFCEYVAAAETEESRASFADNAKAVLDASCDNSELP